MTPDGLASYPSGHSPKETMIRPVAAMATRDMTAFARIDHTGAAAKVGMTAPPKAVAIFGNRGPQRH